MNNYALSLLNTAYKQYQKHDNPHYSVQLIGNANDIVAYRNALKNLSEDGYIENLQFSGLLAEFDISAVGIEYMRLNGKL